MSVVQEIFAGSTGRPHIPDLPPGIARTRRFEDYKELLVKAHQRHDTGGDVLVFGEGVRERAQRSQLDARMAKIESLTKGLSTDQLAAIQQDINQLRDDVAKDWNQAYPETGGYNTQLAPYNLQDPAKILVPRQTPLRNTVPRTMNG